MCLVVKLRAIVQKNIFCGLLLVLVRGIAIGFVVGDEGATLESLNCFSKYTCVHTARFYAATLVSALWRNATNSKNWGRPNSLFGCAYAYLGVGNNK